ncbi:lipoxygenase [Terfezia claveryi]|nr:lipoxygenase [Terfezia claveryi]
MSSFRSQPDFGIPGSAHLRAVRAGSSLNSQPNEQFLFPEFSEVDDDIDAEPLKEWNKGVFSETLWQFAPPTEEFKSPEQHVPSRRPPTAIGRPLYRKFDLDKSVLLGTRPRLVSPPTLPKGTLNGTKVAATEVYKRILQRHASYFDTTNFESSAPQPLGLKKKQALYTWQLPKSPADYPPHLAVIPYDVRSPLFPGENLLRGLFWWSAGWVIPKNLMDIINRILPDSDIPPIDAIFNAMRLMDTAVLLGQVFPEEIIDWVNFNPGEGPSLASITARNATLVKEKKGIYTVQNIGSEYVEDWFTDALFAQQHLTGPNPCTLELANDKWVSQFRREAEIQNKKAVLQLIDEARGKPTPELYIQDYSYFRKAINIPGWQTISSQPQGSAKGKNAVHTDSSDKVRFAVASVCLFQLESTTGRLHPLAIIIDYKDKIEDSVVIFNQRLRETDDNVDQAKDWPWRYAKTCVQVSDWTRHEVTVHLVETHFIEEAVIVAANRSFEAHHPVYKLLSPHWIKTLSLNAAARTTLVPDVVTKLSGMTTAQLMLFMQDAYSTFDWQENYIPTDLERRGFPVTGINDDKFRNCGYARNMHVLWQILQTFVGDYLDATGFKSDAAVAKDPWIARWCMEMTSINPSNKKYYPGASIKNFPFIKTRKQLIDAVTMCIHIASPQHTAVNYLQEYYQTFVLNKPPALYTPPVQSLSELNAMSEKKLMDTLPIDMPREWLLAAHIPHLLNMTVAKEQNLVNYAKSVYESVKSTDGQRLDQKHERLKEVARDFWKALMGFSKVIDKFNKEMDNELPPYVVLKPDVTAVSILI